MRKTRLVLFGSTIALLLAISRPELGNTDAVEWAGKLKLSVLGAEYIVKGEMIDVRRRQVFLRYRTPLSHDNAQMYFDTGKIVVVETLWGSDPGDTVSVCFPSAYRRLVERGRPARSYPEYNEGDTGIWLLEERVAHFPYRILPGYFGSRFSMMRPLSEESLVREILSERE